MQLFSIYYPRKQKHRLRVLYTDRKTNDSRRIWSFRNLENFWDVNEFECLPETLSTIFNKLFYICIEMVSIQMMLELSLLNTQKTITLFFMLGHLT